MTQFFGKYRGKVVNNVDPMQMGRVQVSVPAVFGEGQMSWALPCAPYGGSQVGFFAIPPTNADVWVEFEAGDPNVPIWSGCFWGQGDAPASPPLPSTKVLKTDAVTLTIDDLLGAVTLEVQSGAKIKIDAQGIEIDNGMGAKIKLTANQVSVNDGALEVM